MSSHPRHLHAETNTPSALPALAAGTYTHTVTLPCKTGTPGKECPQYVPPEEPCTRTLPATTVTAPPAACEAETVTATCTGWVCRGPCETVDGPVETVTAC